MKHHEKRGESDDWYTPKFVFEALGVVFDMDVAAPIEGPRYVPCKEWIFEDSLSKPWGGLVWMNPPFGGRSDKAKWLRKFITHGNGLALLPDRTSAPWWQEIADKCDAVLFFNGRIKFERPDGTIGNRPGSGMNLLAIGETGFSAVCRAHRSGIGTMMIPVK